MKKKYVKMSMEVIQIEPANGILTGSFTNVPIKVGTVTVEDFQDGFADDGGFKDISFD